MTGTFLLHIYDACMIVYSKYSTWVMKKPSPLWTFCSIWTCENTHFCEGFWSANWTETFHLHNRGFMCQTKKSCLDHKIHNVIAILSIHLKPITILVRSTDNLLPHTAWTMLFINKQSWRERSISPPVTLYIYPSIKRRWVNVWGCIIVVLSDRYQPFHLPPE